ncbi:hypothetical protein PTRA_a2708 [Pseudoalteromonas translucida KMM 520]|uniref:Uncharacterized protein n=1 Tax=Pseudoalteromonas translucida KMM 520 TaxID=1315283 RepID=A0A0U2WPJ8_9GAMM|nr:hypothetical protein PTRA_a2708 [Pseudoalteromonas translucida KMM 520]
MAEMCLKNTELLCLQQANYLQQDKIIKPITRGNLTDNL